jgi:hypothetical protein
LCPADRLDIHIRDDLNPKEVGRGTCSNALGEGVEVGVTVESKKGRGSGAGDISKRLMDTLYTLDCEEHEGRVVEIHAHGERWRNLLPSLLEHSHIEGNIELIDFNS